jgi:hypothetical protein
MAAAVLAVGLLSLGALLDNSVKASAATSAQEGATSLARQIVEDAHSIPYAQISPSSITGDLQGMSGLANETPGPTWHIARRGVTYTVTVGECAIDEPADGLGKHVNSFGENWFCLGEKESSGKEANEDATPEDLKRVTVDVRWSAIGRAPDVHQVALLSSAGAAPGLSVGELHLEAPVGPDPGVTGLPTQPSITEEPASETLSFAVSAPSSTKAMRWSLEGTTQSPEPVLRSGTTWTFSWPIPLKTVSDGTYEVSVQAIDASGVAGPPVSIPVTLVRSVPAAVAGLKGGFNEVFVSGAKQRVVELEWQANTERNVIGYEVYSPTGQLVCPESETTLSTALSCIDLKPPAPTASNLTYSAVALYRSASGAISKGQPSTVTLAPGPPPAPNPPTKLELQKNAEGAVVLTWQPPSGGEPVAFYRIYRGSTEYSSRYGASTTATFTDTDAATAHSYWVTAVDANLTESAPVGPETR